MSCCLSKGLGCPVGSLVVGDGKDIERARRLRRMLGGGMRQAGVLAACGIYAVENHVERLKDDHETAALLADGLARVLDGRFKVQRPETNMVMVHTDRKETTQAQLASWEKKGVRALALPSGLTIRLVTHLDLPRGAAAEAARRIASY
jgi:threonine aldolase